MGEIVPATHAHAAELAATMRPEDVEEIRACSGRTPLEALEAALELNPTCETLLFDGQVAAMFGVVETQRAGFGSIWMLASKLVERYPTSFLRVCRWTLPRLTAGWDEVGNCVDARNQMHVRWALWMGFEVLPAVPFGVLGLPFHPILWRPHV